MRSSLRTNVAFVCIQSPIKAAVSVFGLCKLTQKTAQPLYIHSFINSTCIHSAMLPRRETGISWVPQTRCVAVTKTMHVFAQLSVHTELT